MSADHLVPHSDPEVRRDRGIRAWAHLYFRSVSVGVLSVACTSWLYVLPSPPDAVSGSPVRVVTKGTIVSVTKVP